MCEHLRELEAELIARGIPVTFRGQAWSRNCREWVYFNCHLDLPAIRSRLGLAACVIDHIHKGTHNGAEKGFDCNEHHDGIMGALEPSPAYPTIR